MKDVSTARFRPPCLRRLDVPTFKYTACKSLREEYTISGTIVARNEKEAREELKLNHFDNVRLRRIRGLGAIWNRWSADIRVSDR